MDPATRTIVEGLKARQHESPKTTNPVLWPEPYAQDNPETLFQFLTECCWTYNEADREVDLIPATEYIRTVAHEWHEARAQSRTLIIEKSRRMLISWVLRGCELWSLGLRQEKGLVAGLDYSKAGEHVWRIWWLYDQLVRNRPELELPKATPRDGNVAAQQLGQVLLANGSLAETLNQDGLAFQGSGYGWVTMEEFSRYRNCDYMFAQAVRVTQGKAANASKTRGGNVVIVTNASPNKAWQQIKSLRGNQNPVTNTPIYLADCANGSRYLRIHYSADPGKTPGWAALEKPKVPIREWLREMEMKEDVYEGEPVFADYRDDWHNMNGDARLPKVSGSFYIGGWDCGQTLNPAFVLLQVTPNPCQVHALLEVLAPGPEPMEKFAPRVLKELHKLVPAYLDDIEHWGDTTVIVRNGANGETAQQAARRYGIRIRPASNEWNSRFGAVTWLLTDDISEKYPRFMIDGGRCPILRDGFRGAYRFDLSNQGGIGPERIYPEHPRKDGYSHVQDALQYAACRVKSILKWGRKGR
jgi:hypothetical protein